MSKKWKRLSAALHTAEGRDFERVVLPFVRAIWADAIIPQPLRSTYDQSGVDILVWRKTDSRSIFLAVQCKGFSVKEYELGVDQIQQCKDSIKKFIESGIHSEIYVLVHNRIPSNETFRAELEQQATKLKASGRARVVYIWGAQKLLQEATKAVRNRYRQVLLLDEPKVEQFLIDQPLCAPLEKVPLRISELTFNRNRMIAETAIEDVIADPTRRILETARSNLSLVLGQAGYGKTTSALRTLADGSRKIFYLSAAILPDVVGNTDTLFKRWINLEKLFEGVLDEDIPIVEQLAAPAITYILKDEKIPVILILDALDESIYFSRPGGLQQLFNQISDARVPIILLARSEFWEDKQQDFANSYGLRSPTKEDKFNRRVTVIRLLEWQHDQIRALAQRFRDKLAGRERTHVENLIRVIDSGEYEDIYGDIPKRPLFLRFILESVAEQGVMRKGRARLFYDWAALKIRRDVLNPRTFGGEGRAPILTAPEGTETVLRLAFKAMKIAAYKMTDIPEPRHCLELLPSCDIEEILLSDDRLKMILSPTGLFLHSLLIPVKSTAEKLEVSFAHRTFQEFFLALYIRENTPHFADLELPKAINDHLTAIRDEGI